MTELGIDTVYNADQMPVYFEHFPTQTLDAKGARTVWLWSTEKTNERIMCMSFGDSSKFDTFLVMKATAATKKEVADENNRVRQRFSKRL